MDRLITRDGWRKSTRSGANNPNCVEGKVVTREEAESLGMK
ncbi:DUF397 domain-containing protein [Actinoallomurus iriomotensis]